MPAKQMTVCFSGYRPEKLPWGYDEDDPRCAALKERLRQAVTAQNSKRAVTHWRVLERFGRYTLIEARLETGELDALAVAAGAPFPAVSALEARGEARYLPVTPDQVLALRLAFPELGTSTIPAGTYASLRQGYDTVGLFNFAVARPDLPTSLVQAIAEAVFANNDDLVAAHPAAAATIPRNFARNTFLPFHLGATRYYISTATPGVDLTD